VLGATAHLLDLAAAVAVPLTPALPPPAPVTWPPAPIESPHCRTPVSKVLGLSTVLEALAAPLFSLLAAFLPALFSFETARVEIRRCGRGNGRTRG
jgi:hypothetical protein